MTDWCSNRALAIFKNPSSTISNALSDPVALAYFVPAFSEATLLYKILKNHTNINSFMQRFSEVLDICFSDNNNDISSKVIILFTKLDTNIIDFDTFNSVLIEKSEVLFSNPVENGPVIGRLSSIILFSALNCKQKSAVLAPLIIKMLNYIKSYDCCEIFHSICDYNSDSPQLSESLIKANFANSIMYELSKTDDAQTIANLLKVIRMCSGNKYLKETVRKPEICVQLFAFLSNEEKEVRNQLWRCLTGLISDQTCQTLKQALDNAIKNVGESFDSVDMFRIYSFDFIGKLLHFLPSISDELVSKQFLEITFKCIIQFPECTHLIASVFRFVRTSYHISSMKKWFFSVFVPFMMATVKGTDRNSMSANCFLLLSDLETTSQNDYQLKEQLLSVHGYKKFCDEVLYPKIHIQNSPYGGKIIRDGPFIFND